MFGLGLWELAVVFVVALIVFGPQKLPMLFKQAGRAMREFQRAAKELQYSIEDATREEEIAKKKPTLSASEQEKTTALAAAKILDPTTEVTTGELPLPEPNQLHSATPEPYTEKKPTPQSATSVTKTAQAAAPKPKSQLDQMTDAFSADDNENSEHTNVDKRYTAHTRVVRSPFADIDENELESTGTVKSPLASSNKDALDAPTTVSPNPLLDDDETIKPS